MEKREKKEIPARIEDQLVGYVCDLCGKESSRSGYWGEGYNVDEPTVEIETGYNTPSGGSKTTRAYHVCPECFRGKLEPWLKEQGATPTEEHSGW